MIIRFDLFDNLEANWSVWMNGAVIVKYVDICRLNGEPRVLLGPQFAYREYLEQIETLVYQYCHIGQ